MTQEWSAAEGISRTYSPTWDVLICSVTYRTEMLDALLTELGSQLEPGVGVRVFRDNLQTSLALKCHRLLESSEADYVSFVDDDDWVAEDYVSAIMGALRLEPDYVGFTVRWTINDNPQLPVFHSLEHGGWRDTPDALYRDISHLNPIRRELAVRSGWSERDPHICDAQWANDLRALGCVKTEVFIDRDMYHYRWRPEMSFNATSQYQPMGDPPPPPAHDFVTWVT